MKLLILVYNGTFKKLFNGFKALFIDGCCPYLFPKLFFVFFLFKRSKYERHLQHFILSLVGVLVQVRENLVERNQLLESKSAQVVYVLVVELKSGVKQDWIAGETFCLLSDCTLNI